MDRRAHRVRPAQQTGWMRWLPGIDSIRHYEIAWLAHDVLAGLVLTAVLVPVGIAYAVASGVAPICGLYATIFGLLAYALFGPSRVLVLGPDSSLVALTLGVVLSLSAGDPQRAMILAAMMSVVSGCLCVLAGTARLGFITELLSKPIRYGYMNGIALTVLISQLPTLFGFSVKSDGLFGAVRGFVEAIVAGKTNWVALALGAGTLATILLVKRSKKYSGLLLAVAGATIIVAVFDLAKRFGVVVLGPLPQGLPAMVIPWIESGRHRPGAARRRDCGLGLVCRHERALSHLCGAQGRPGRCQSGNGRSRGRQPRSRALSGHAGEREFLTHAGCRGRGCQDAA